MEWGSGGSRRLSGGRAAEGDDGWCSITQHLPVKCGVGLPLRLASFASIRQDSSGGRAAEGDDGWCSITKHLPVKSGVGLPLRLAAFAAGGG